MANRTNHPKKVIPAEEPVIEEIVNEPVVEPIFEDPIDEPFPVEEPVFVEEAVIEEPVIEEAVVQPVPRKFLTFMEAFKTGKLPKPPEVVEVPAHPSKKVFSTIPVEEIQNIRFVAKDGQLLRLDVYKSGGIYWLKPA